MIDKILYWFAGGDNHYPMINQWKAITEFIREYITTNPDLVYLLQLVIFSLFIITILFIVLYPLTLVLGTIVRIIKSLYHASYK